MKRVLFLLFAVGLAGFVWAQDPAPATQPQPVTAMRVACPRGANPKNEGSSKSEAAIIASAVIAALAVIITNSRTRKAEADLASKERDHRREADRVARESEAKLAVAERRQCLYGRLRALRRSLQQRVFSHYAASVQFMAHEAQWRLADYEKDSRYRQAAESDLDEARLCRDQITEAHCQLLEALANARVYFSDIPAAKVLAAKVFEGGYPSLPDSPDEKTTVADVRKWREDNLTGIDERVRCALRFGALDELLALIDAKLTECVIHDRNAR